MWEICPLASSAHVFLQLFQAYHSENILYHSGITFPFERINHAQSEMIYQASHQGLQHPLKWKYLFPSTTVII